MGFIKDIGSIFSTTQPKKCPKCGSDNINNELVQYDGVEDENTQQEDLIPSGDDECQDCGHIF